MINHMAEVYNYKGCICNLLSEQKLFGKVICIVYIPELNKVERVPKELLLPVDTRALQASPEELQAIAAAGKVFDALNNYSQTFGEDVLLAPLDSAVTPLPHQLDTLKCAIGKNPVRLMLADEVGLGKTIEAGLIIRELKLRGLIRRVLIVAPTGLAKQWISEMKVHFDEEFHLFIPSQIEAAGELLKAARSAMSLNADSTDNPYMLSDNVVCPLDAIKPIRRRKGWTKEQVDEYNMKRFLNVIHADWDLVVIDESHRVAGADENVARFKLGFGLGEAAANILLLTATPHQGKSDAFHRLLSILDADAFPENTMLSKAKIQPYLIRHEKRSTIDGSGNKLFRPRHTYTINVIWEARHVPQQILYDAVTEYIREGYNMMARLTRKKRVVIGFLLVLIQRLMASSTPAIGKTLQKRLEFLKNPPPEEDPELEQAFDDFEELDSNEQESKVVAIPKVCEAEISQVESLLDLVKRAVSAGPDAKAEKLLELLYELQSNEADPNVKMLVFTEFTATQEMLKEFFLRRGISCCLINGSMDMDERLASQNEFAADKRVLISTEAGGEGLNLQFCHVVVNYDMPWNPMRIEQRMGRVDRIGQKHDVQAFNLMIGGTVESRVRQVIEQKLAVILKDIGVDKLSDIIDSGDAEMAFDAVYKAAVQNENRIDEQIKNVEQVLRDAAKAAKQFAFLYESPNITADMAKGYLQHPFPYWVECMVTNYCRANSGIAARNLLDWNLTLPGGKKIKQAVFTMADLANCPTATFLSINHNDVKDILHRLMQGNVTEESVPILQCNELPNEVSGLFGLYRLTAKAGGWARSRVIPVFVSDDGRNFSSTARSIYDMLLAGNGISICGTTEFANGQLFAQVESGMEPVFSEMQQLLETERKQEYEKKCNLFDSRYRSLQKIGIANIRDSRLRKLEEERKAYCEDYGRGIILLPEVNLLIAAKIKGGK